MKNLFKNRYAFVIVGNGAAGKSTLMNKLTGYEKLQYNSSIRLTLNHKTQEAELSSDQNWNTIVSAHSFYGETQQDTIKILEESLKQTQAQFVLVPEWLRCLPRLVSILSQNNYLTTCYHIIYDEDEANSTGTAKRYVKILGETTELGIVDSSAYKNNLKKIKQDMYRVIMPMD